MQIEEAVRFDEALLGEINRLLPQLSSSARPLTAGELRTIVESDATRLLLATEGDRVLGMLTVVVFRIPTGVRAWVEDVVVDEAARGRGVAQALLNAAVELAGALQAKTLDLTSRPSREAANRLYQKVGFLLRDTNVYRVELTKK